MKTERMMRMTHLMMIQHLGQWIITDHLFWVKMIILMKDRSLHCFRAWLGYSQLKSVKPPQDWQHHSSAQTPVKTQFHGSPLFGVGGEVPGVKYYSALNTSVIITAHVHNHHHCITIIIIIITMIITCSSWDCSVDTGSSGVSGGSWHRCVLQCCWLEQDWAVMT